MISKRLSWLCFDFFAAVITERMRYVNMKHDSTVDFSNCATPALLRMKTCHGTWNVAWKEATQLQCVCVSVQFFFVATKTTSTFAAIFLSCCLIQTNMYSDNERVFLLSLERCFIFGDLSEGVMQATSAMFVINHPWGYVEVGFCHPPTEKITFKFEQDRNHHEIAASLHARFRIAA